GQAANRAGPQGRRPIGDWPSARAGPQPRTASQIRKEPSAVTHDRALNPPEATPNVSLADLQALIRRMYFEKDQARGIEGTFIWLIEEIGELATALRSGTHQERLEEFADVLAWLATIANVAGVDLSEAIAKKYGSGCPGCGQFVCRCPDSEKP